MLRLIGCVGRTLVGVALLALVAFAWLRGPDLWARLMGNAPPQVVEPSAESANEALVRYRSLVTGDVSEVRISAHELESLLRFELNDQGVLSGADPTVELDAGEIRLDMSIPVDRFTDASALGIVRSIVPKRVPVGVRGTFVESTNPDALLMVRRVSLMGIPIPRRMFLPILAALGDGDSANGRPPEAVPIPLPPGVRSMRVADDLLVLVGGT